MYLCMVVVFVALSSEAQVFDVLVYVCYMDQMRRWRKTVESLPGSIIGLASGIIKTLALLK